MNAINQAAILMGKKGGAMTVKKYGKKYMSKLGKKSAAKKKENKKSLLEQ